jgi:hypothetical protein
MICRTKLVIFLFNGKYVQVTPNLYISFMFVIKQISVHLCVIVVCKSFEANIMFNFRDLILIFSTHSPLLSHVTATSGYSGFSEILFIYL